MKLISFLLLTSLSLNLIFGSNKNKYLSSAPSVIPKTGLSWPQGQVLPHFAAVADTLDGFNIFENKPPLSEKLMFAALQGLVNKNKPRIFLYDVVREGKNKWPDNLQLKIAEYPADRKWDLVKKYKIEIAGVILYDTMKSRHYVNLATTVAGLKNALPVTQREYELLSANGIKFPILADLSKLSYTTTTEIYNYLYKTYWKDCSKRLLVSLNPKTPVNIRDICIASGAACMWLDPRKEEENKVMRKFLGDMKAGESIMLGWWAEERSGIGIGTEYGISTIPSDFYENATVYAGMPHIINLPVVPKKPELKNKIYLAIFLSDGDNVQYCQHAMSNLWDNKNRGIIPINWTVSPGLTDIGPGLLNYYYATATPNDFLASGPSGLGYALLYDEHNKKWHVTNDKHIDAYTRLSQRYIEKSGLRVITIWDELSEAQMDIYASNCRYLYGVTREDWEMSAPFQTVVKQNRLTFMPNHPCYASNIKDIYVRWEKQIKTFDGSKPLFLSAQGESWKMGPENIVALKEQLDKLSPGNIIVCRGDHFFTLRNEANGNDFNLTMSPEMTISSSATTTRADFAADGSPSVGKQWIASDKGTQWIQFDFKRTYLISRYVVRHAGSAGMDAVLNTRSFQLEVSVDNVNWSTADRYKGNTDDVTDVDIAPIKARYARLLVTDAGKDGIVRIGDVEIYGKVEK